MTRPPFGVTRRKRSEQQRGAERAIRLARPAGTEIVLFHAFDAVSAVAGDPMAMAAHANIAEREAEIALLENIASRIRNLHVDARLRVTEQAAAAAILEAADDENAEVIILGTHARHGLDRVLLGSAAETVVRKAACRRAVAGRVRRSRARGDAAGGDRE